MLGTPRGGDRKPCPLQQTANGLAGTAEGSTQLTGGSCWEVDFRGFRVSGHSPLTVLGRAPFPPEGAAPLPASNQILSLVHRPGETLLRALTMETLVSHSMQSSSPLPELDWEGGWGFPSPSASSLLGTSLCPERWGAKMMGHRFREEKESCACSAAQGMEGSGRRSGWIWLPHLCLSPITPTGLGLRLIKCGRFLLEACSPGQELGLQRKGQC